MSCLAGSVAAAYIASALVDATGTMRLSHAFRAGTVSIRRNAGTVMEVRVEDGGALVARTSEPPVHGSE